MEYKTTLVLLNPICASNITNNNNNDNVLFIILYCDNVQTNLYTILYLITNVCNISKYDSLFKVCIMQ